MKSKKIQRFLKLSLMFISILIFSGCSNSSSNKAETSVSEATVGDSSLQQVNSEPVIDTGKIDKPDMEQSKPVSIQKNDSKPALSDPVTKPISAKETKTSKTKPTAAPSQKSTLVSSYEGGKEKKPMVIPKNNPVSEKSNTDTIAEPVKEDNKTVEATTTEEWMVPAKYKNRSNPIEADAESLSIGKSLYKKHCASCHGKTGLGDGTKAAQLDTPSGDFTLLSFQKQTDGSLLYKTKEGRGDMPKFKKKLPDEEDIWHIINYIRTFN